VHYLITVINRATKGARVAPSEWLQILYCVLNIKALNYWHKW